MNETTGKRIAFVVNARTGDELQAGNRDSSRLWTLLTDPNLGRCEPIYPPLHNCENEFSFLKELKEILKKLNSSDQLLFYFSGHGIVKNQQYCIKLGLDEDSYYPFKNLINQLRASGIERAIIIIDACHSGKILSEIGTKKNEFNPLENLELELPKGIAIIASCQESQKSYELADSSSSVFTHLLCQAIEGGLDGQATPNSLISISDVIGYIQKQLETNKIYKSYPQKPIFTINGANQDIWIAKNKSGLQEIDNNIVHNSKIKIISSQEDLRLLYEKTVPSRHPCIEARIEELDWDSIIEYAQRVYPNELWKGKNREDILDFLSLYSPIDYLGQRKLHKSAVLCFHKYPDKIFSTARSIFVFGQLDSPQFQREEICGSLPYQFKQLMERVTQKIEKISYIDQKGLRQETDEIDLVVVRELISNAITHRDYNKSGNITVKLTPQALEVHSPGNFPDSISWEQLIYEDHTLSVPVDEALSMYLSRLLVLEGIGRGFSIIRKYIKDNGEATITHTFKGDMTCIRLLRILKEKIGILIPSEVGIVGTDAKSKTNLHHISEEDIFAKTFYYLEGEGQLPGALLPEGIIVDEQKRILTPLLPLKPKILDYFSPEELIKRLAFNPTTIGNQSAVRVSLTLPLSGGDFTIHREYPIEVNNAITAKPFLEIWPNFKAPNWKAYYALYFDNRTEATKQNKIFRAVFPEAREIHPLDLKDFQITRLDSFPDYILCQDEIGISQGLIVLKTPPNVGDQNPNKTWTVGVDYGTSFTTAYYQTENIREPVTLTPLHLQVTQVSQIIRFCILYYYFMSGEAETFPVSSTLTIRGGAGQERPILDGRVYILGDVRAFDPTQDDIKTDLKWHPQNIAYTRTFLKHLALLITAEAAKNHVKKINWSISYPSAFSRSDKNLYKVTWQRIIEDLGKTTGIDHKWLDRGNPYRAESLALAHYFADEEGKDLLYTTCIDMGGGTSDISIWVGNRLIHQCSVQIAGRLLFSQFWKNRPDFLNQQFNTDLSDLSSSLRDEPFFVKLDGLLAAEGSKWLERNRTLMDDDTDLQTIVQLSTLGISGLYYYIGLVLRALDIEEKYTRKLNTPVYIGGNGSRILNWLDLSGRFSPDCETSLLFSRLLSKASGFENKKEPTVLSSKPKAEVACGLVLDQNVTRLTGLQDDDEVIFAGEDCEVNGKAFGWQDRLDLTQFQKIESFKLVGSDDEEVGLANLQKFLEDFQQAFKELKITSIKPLRQYDDEQWRNSLWTKVKRSVESNLTNLEGRNSEDVRVEPPFILGLKALLKELNSRL
ncbi:hypothetical protein MiYa_00780 [Microcystis aeruginosa NIES-2519]|uniref:Peptidase C14 caspase domain-containing protein n=1 Tax=Microcystis aeruginosa NIES-2519 TaxID=2303981 RepID=A0A5A5R3Q2_MICAE|nr:caspase family protein [Microcystis aeruginosa]GCA69255.1 hypothetical protein MiYa_00780 [Microcystis aeruginosa NIES-2519]GCA82123.1 hypothetical protein MiHa_00073 [Microcystis aeruginosa NIES-2522]